MNNLIYIPIMAFVVAAISFTISTTSMFKWLRELVSPIHHKIEELIHCPWCLAHWITFILLWCIPSSYIIEVVPVIENSLVLRSFNFLFTTFAIIGLVGLLHYVLLRAYEPVAKAMAMRQLEKMQAQRHKPEE